jgi:elongation factor Ts
MKVASIARFKTKAPGVVAVYVHHNQKVGALVSVGAAKSTPELAETSRQLAMHIAYAKPLSMTREEIPAADVQREKDVARGQLEADPKMKGKPAQVLDKIMEGKVDAFYKEKVLAEQRWFRDDTKSVTDMLKSVGGTLQKFSLTIVGS